MSGITYPDGDRINYGLNAFGEATSAVRAARTGRLSQSYANNATYYSSGNLNTFVYGNGLIHKTTLNSRQIPNRIRDYKGTKSALDYSYTFDGNLNVKRIADNLNSAYSLTNLTYDGLDRLRTTDGGSSIGSSNITYDTLGNIKTYTSKGRNLKYNYRTTDNRLTSVNGVSGKYSTFAYDDRGNIYSNGAKSFTYNRANQMVSSGNNTYVYDAHNRRVKHTESKGTSYSIYGYDGILLYREAPTGAVNYIHLGDKLIAKDGVIPENSAKQHYRPFGESIEGEIDDVGYTGHKFDADIGLSYMQARYYDPVIGRFYSNDPVDAVSHLSNAEGIKGFNRYSYAVNNPYKYSDPDGRSIQSIMYMAPTVGIESVKFY